jgi:hypothetical protein
LSRLSWGVIMGCCSTGSVSLSMQVAKPLLPVDSKQVQAHAAAVQHILWSAALFILPMSPVCAHNYCGLVPAAGMLGFCHGQGAKPSLAGWGACSHFTRMLSWQVVCTTWCFHGMAAWDGSRALQCQGSWWRGRGVVGS